MANSRWLKAVPEKEPEQAKDSTPNVSMRDVRRIAQEKAARAEQDRALEPTEQKHTEIPTTPATQSTHTTHSTQGSQPQKHPIAPARDFMKVPNSITRQAVPSGLFAGKGKQIYDYLYSRTRGAIQPARLIQLRRREIMDGAHVGSDKTLRENLIRLRAAGLISWTGDIGAHAGNIYTVYLPEEASPATLGTQGTLGSRGSEGTQGSASYFLPSVPTVESTQGTQGLSVDNTDTSGSPKTSFKTNTERSDDDDAALASLNAALKQAAKELTGKEVSLAESARWRELAEVLITEAKIAGARTTVSSFPAFLAEHLRRRLWKKDKSQLESEGRTEAQQTPTMPSLTEEQIKSCPDCGGSTWYYPEGTEKGIKRCRHEKLREGI
jgi:hypothetical protein